MSETRSDWDAAGVRALRERLGMTQRRFADELGVRQQTVSEWETGAYQPRGASARLLRIVAERATGYDASNAAGNRQPARGSRGDEPEPAKQG